MMTADIIQELNCQIAALEKAKALLLGGSVQTTKHRRPAGPESLKTRSISPEGRERIAAAQRARWAKQRRQNK
jgi:hypothetical protein